MKLFLLYRDNSKQRGTINPALTSTKEYPVPPGEEQENDNDDDDNDNDNDDNDDDDTDDVPGPEITLGTLASCQQVTKFGML